MYRKITKNFKNIKNLKSLLKDVYKAKSNHLVKISKLRLKEDLIPDCVEKVEIEIKGLTRNETITVPKTSLTFLTGNSLPFTTIQSDSNVKDKYIVLPWNLETNSGRAELKSLIDKIPSSIRGVLTTITYALYVHEDEGINQILSSPQEIIVSPNAGQNTTTTLSTTSTATPITTPAVSTSQAIIPHTNILNSEIISESIEDFSWTGNSFSEDNEEKLLDEIDKLKVELAVITNNYNHAKNEIITKTSQIHNLNSQVANLNNTNNSLQNQLTIKANQSWTLFLPTTLNGGVLRKNSQPTNLQSNFVQLSGVGQNAKVENITGNVILDITNKRLFVSGNSCGEINIF